MRADQLLDLDRYVGQVSTTYRFELVDGPTGIVKGPITPLRDSTVTLSHDTSSTITRRVSGIVLGVDDAKRIDPLRDRIMITMVLGDADRTEYPLGRYMVADTVDALHTNGTLLRPTLYDEMFIVDQDLDKAFSANGQLVDQAILRLLDGLPIGEAYVDATEHTADNSWSAGSSRAAALNELAKVGGYFKPWFDRQGRLRVIRAFEPGDQAPDIDLDDPPRVYRESISRVTDALTAPNRFVVVSNDDAADGGSPVYGVYDVPSSAPHSIAQRGFVIPQVVDAQVSTNAQAAAYARTLGIQQTVYERVELSTPPDPRHDGYNVIRWDGRLWLEVAWSMQLEPGGEMQHTLRRAYPTTSEEG